MKASRLSFLTLALLAIFSYTIAQHGPEKMDMHAKHITFTPQEMKWGPAPPALPAGAQAVILQGDPSKAGSPFTIRAKFPDGYKVPPHWHPADENVVVIQGSLWLGTGEKFDTATARELPAGSYALMPKGVRHFAQAKGETIINVYGTGPFELNYVNPADDPRTKK